jgi:hypothetical protein
MRLEGAKHNYFLLRTNKSTKKVRETYFLQQIKFARVVFVLVCLLWKECVPSREKYGLYIKFNNSCKPLF